VVTALMKLVAQNGSCPQRVAGLVGGFRLSRALDLQQWCVEFRALLSHPAALVEALPVDASCEDLQDLHLQTLLDGFVQKALLQVPFMDCKGHNNKNGQ